MFRRLLKYKWYILVILVLIIVEPMITSWLILWLQKLYNQVTVGTPRMTVIRLILVGVLIWLGKRLLLYTVSVIKSRFVCGIKQDLKHDVFLKALNLNTASISQIASSGEYISALTNDITIIEQRFFSNIISISSQFISIVILGASFISMNRKLSLMMLFFSLIVIIVPSVFAKKLNSANLSYSSALSRLTQKLKEYLMAYSTVKNYSIEKQVLHRFDESNDAAENAKFEYDCSLALADNTGSLLTWFTRIVVIGAGLILVANGEILIGTVIAAQEFAAELATPLQGIVENANSIKSVRSILKRIGDMTEEKQVTGADPDGMAFVSENSVDVEFRKLSVPGKSRRIVDDFSFRFVPGGKYLVVGKNGSGKSSVFKALKKRFSSYDGQILINGTDVRRIGNDELSSLVAYLNENVSIFSGTVSDNITLWRDVKTDDLIRAMEKAHVELNVQRQVGEDGFDISSGEQRRIEVARSLISPSQFLVFDEVVSTLDIETAYEFEKMALSYPEKTVVFISHNFSGKLIRQYDEILVMKDGSLVAHGPYDRLIEESEYFRHICEIKFGEAENDETR